MKQQFFSDLQCAFRMVGFVFFAMALIAASMVSCQPDTAGAQVGPTPTAAPLTPYPEPGRDIVSMPLVLKEDVTIMSFPTKPVQAPVDVGFIQSELWTPFIFAVRWVDAPLTTVGQSLELWCTLRNDEQLSIAPVLQIVTWTNDGDIVWAVLKNFMGYQWVVVGCRGYWLDPDDNIIDQTAIARGWFVDYSKLVFLPLVEQ